MRDGARLLAADTRCKAADGDPRGALENIGAMFSIAEHTAADSILVMQLVAIAIDRIAAGTLEAVLASGTATAEDLAAANIHDHISYRKQLARALRMEEAFGLSILCQVGGGDEPLWTFMARDEDIEGPVFEGLVIAAPLYRVFLLKDDVATYRENMYRLGSLSARPYYEVKEEFEAVEKQFSSRPQGIVTQCQFPALSPCVKVCARGDARRGAARVGLAMCRYRAAKQAFPETLQELVPEFLPAVPRDPFCGQPLRLKSTDQDLIIYSIGPNGKDDDGVPFDREEETGDITFRLVR